MCWDFVFGSDFAIIVICVYSSFCFYEYLFVFCCLFLTVGWSVIVTFSENPDEMLHYAAFHQGQHCLLRLKQSSENET